MTIRLRVGPSRRRRNFDGAIGVGLALATVVAGGFGVARLAGSVGSSDDSVRIERLDGVAAEAFLPPRPKPFLDKHRIVAYCGNPLVAQMGILGEYEPEEVVSRLRETS